MFVLLAVSALSGSANIRTIQMSKGENKINVLQAPSGILRVLGAEYFTTERTGNVKMSVRKIFSGKVRDFTVTPIYDKVITKVHDWYEYSWIATEVVSTQTIIRVGSGMSEEKEYGPLVCWTNRYEMKMESPQSTYFKAYAADLERDNMVFPKKMDQFDYWYIHPEATGGSIPRDGIRLGYLSIIEPGSINPHSMDGVFQLPQSNKGHFEKSWDSFENGDYKISYNLILDKQTEAEYIDHYHEVTNQVQISAITNWYNAVVCNTNTIEMIASTPLTNGYANISIQSPKYIYINDTIIIDAPITKDKPGIIRLIVDTEN